MILTGLNQPWGLTLGITIAVLAVIFFVWYARKIIKSK